MDGKVRSMKKGPPGLSFVRIWWVRSLDLLHDGLEAVGVGVGDLGQGLAVQVDVGFFSRSMSTPWLMPCSLRPRR